MRLLISHDAHGTISAICAPGETFGDAIGIVPPPGNSLSVIEVDKPMEARQLARIANEFFVLVGVDRPQLVRREPSSPAKKPHRPMRGGPSHVE